MYQGGTSEEWIGKFLRERGGRDRVVLATKFANGMHPGDPNGGGNGRKHVVEACDASLRRLKHRLHGPLLAARLGQGHSRRGGHGDARPARDVRARCVTSGSATCRPGSSAARRRSPSCAAGSALSLSSSSTSLVTREIEREFVPAASALGLGICPWSPLANGILTGKYKKTAAGKIAGEGRMGMGGFATGVNSDLRERNVADRRRHARGREGARPQAGSGRDQLGHAPPRRLVDDPRARRARAARGERPLARVRDPARSAPAPRRGQRSARAVSLQLLHRRSHQDHQRRRHDRPELRLVRAP